MSEWFEWSDAPPGDFAVIGDPVSHSLSPRMHRAAYRKLELSFAYHAVRVQEGEFALAVTQLAALGYQGVNVTVPLKLAALEWCKTNDAGRMGAVNTLNLKTGAGTNTDGPGFMETLRALGQAPCKTLVLGAGGSSRAVCVSLEDAGFEVSLWNRTASRARELVSAAELAAEVIEYPRPAGHGLIINATSTGLCGESLQIDWLKAPSDALVYDLSYTDGHTPFQASALECGLKAVDGRAMLVAQGALSFEWWTGLDAPREDMMDAVL